jgi:glycerophosphoryl diester phosphodiesterase
MAARAGRLAGLLFAFTGLLAAGAESKPLVNAHAHNDYEHARPLLDALDRGFCSVEADVWLVDGQLLVAHDRGKVKPGRTLQALYLDPLRARVAQNGGRAYAGGPSLTLMVDVKSDAKDTWLALRAALRPYESILTRFGRDGMETGAVTVVISGNRARDLMASETNRLAAYDGRLSDLESGAPPQFIPLVSDQWQRLSTWRGGVGKPLPAADERRLRETVSKAHAQGRRIRFWGAPDTPAVWSAFRSAGVDLLNADDLDGLQEFLLKP